MTILDQIEDGYTGIVNGHKISALRLMGAKDFVYDENSVTFTVQGPRDFNKFKVSLNASDYYDVELWKTGIIDEEPFIIKELVDEYKDVSCGELANCLVREVLYWQDRNK